jgi:hypothetical protein
MIENLRIREYLPSEYELCNQVCKGNEYPAIKIRPFTFVLDSELALSNCPGEIQAYYTFEKAEEALLSQIQDKYLEMEEILQDIKHSMFDLSIAKKKYL